MVKEKKKLKVFRTMKQQLGRKIYRKLKRLGATQVDFQTALDYKKTGFLVAFTQLGSINQAARIVQIKPEQVRRWKKKDPVFLKLFKRAEEAITMTIEDEALRRATEGQKRIILYKGQPVLVPKNLKKPNGAQKIYVEHTPSDTLLMFLLRGRAPNKYRNNVDLTSGGDKLQYKEIKGVSTDEL